MTKQISKEQAAKLVELHNDGTIFTVTFVKRSDGKTRVMNCRKGVKKYVTGKGLKYDPKKHSLVSVFDVEEARRLKGLDLNPARAYRSISLESIIRIAIKGVEYIVS